MFKKDLEVHKTTNISINTKITIKKHNIKLIKTNLLQLDWLFYQNTIWIQNILSKEKQNFTINNKNS